MLRLIVTALVAAGLLGVCALRSLAQTPASTPQPAVIVPVFNNTSCPIMGKPVSTKLFVDTPKGRIYMCCKSCIQDIRDDVDGAHASAYPLVQKIANAVCPVTGTQLDPKQARTMVLQGYEFSVASEDAVARARENAQVTLVRLTHPEAIDLQNGLCPVSGEPAEKNTIVVIGDTIVHLSSRQCIPLVQSAPQRFLDRAKELRAKELHDAAVHPAPPPPAKGGNG